jgi:hypothetical protein
LGFLRFGIWDLGFRILSKENVLLYDFTLRPAPCTMRFASSDYQQQPAPLSPSILNPKSQITNPKSKGPELVTRNPKPATRNPHIAIFA